jgi:acetylornithine deacetylase
VGFSGVKDEVEILLDLVAISSVSSASNRPVIDYVLKRLNPAAWKIKLHPYRDPKGIAKVNLVAIACGPTARQITPELTLVCHTDTVPYDAAWPDAVNPHVRNGKLFGRGSCDVKGFLACVLACVSKLDLAQLNKPLAIMLTADEEIGCVGAKYLAAKKALHSRYMIIGEPTGLRPVCAGKGYALAEIVVHGKEAHSAFPARGRSAIYDAARIVTALERIAGKLQARKDRSFDPPFTTLNVGLIQGGTAKNIVAGECRITVEWRPIPGQDPGWAAELIREELARLRVDAEFNVHRLDPGFAPTATDDVAKLLESLTRHGSTTVAFGTEAPHLRSLTSETVVFGPGNMTVAHKTGEFVPLAELSKCVAHLREVIQEVCRTGLLACLVLRQ